MPLCQKAYKYGPKRKNTSLLTKGAFDDVLCEKGPKRSRPLKDGIWAKARTSPFKGVRNVIAPLSFEKGSIDAYGCCVEGAADPFAFEDDDDEVVPVISPKLGKTGSPVKASVKKEVLGSSCVISPLKSRHQGKTYSADITGVTVNDMKCKKSPIKRTLGDKTDKCNKTSKACLDGGRSRLNPNKTDLIHGGSSNSALPLSVDLKTLNTNSPTDCVIQSKEAFSDHPGRAKQEDTLDHKVERKPRLANTSGRRKVLLAADKISLQSFENETEKDICQEMHGSSGRVIQSARPLNESGCSTAECNEPEVDSNAATSEKPCHNTQKPELVFGELRNTPSPRSLNKLVNCRNNESVLDTSTRSQALSSTVEPDNNCKMDTEDSNCTNSLISNEISEKSTNYMDTHCGNVAKAVLLSKSSVKKLERQPEGPNLFSYYKKKRAIDERVGHSCKEAVNIFGKQSRMKFASNTPVIEDVSNEENENFTHRAGVTWNNAQNNVVDCGSVEHSENLRKRHRRFSALPTNASILGITEEIEDEDRNEDSSEGQVSSSTKYRSSMFGSFSSLGGIKVKRADKELFTIVRNTKHAHQCLEHGESQQFSDDLDYLMDGIQKSHPVATRCLSGLELAAKCASAAFRMHAKAHGIISQIFNALDDALSDQRLGLCVSAIMYMLAKDKLKTDFDKAHVGLMLKLMGAQSSVSAAKSHEWERLLKKLRGLLEKQEPQLLDLDALSVSSVALESLLSLTAQKIGDWFKEEIRVLGGLDHIIDRVYDCSKLILNGRGDLPLKRFKEFDRCLNLLENVTYRNSLNQRYLVAYRNSIMVESCVRILCFVTEELDHESDLTVEVQDCVFSVLRILTNVSHDFVEGGTTICNQEGALGAILKCALQLPRCLLREKAFDFVVLSLGLLINLVEHSQGNVSILNSAFAPPCYESQSLDDSAVTGVHILSPVEALMQLFLVRIDACKGVDLMQELNALEENEAKNATIKQGDDGDLICGDSFSDTASFDGADGADGDNQLTASQKMELKDSVQSTLDKAHRHMEDSHIAAYSALLIGLLAEENLHNQDVVRSLLPDGDFSIMRESLEKIIAFMKITGGLNDSGLQVIRRAISVFATCQQKIVLASASSVEGGP